MVGPIISGAMAEHTGVESFWWFNTGMLLFTLVVCIFLFPETRYHRAWETGDAPKPPPVRDPNAPLDRADGSLHEKHSGTDHEEALGAPVTQAATQHSSATGNKIAPTDTHVDPALGQGGPGKKQFLPFQPYHGDMFRELWLPFYLHLFPIVEFAAFVVSWSASGFLVVNLSQSQAFAAPPYNFSSQTIGLFNLAVLVGGMVGLFTCGPLSDWVAAYLTRRNNGVREPEMRLVAMVPYIIIMIIGSIVTSVGYDYHWQWEAIVIVGYSFLGCQVAALPSIASTYAIDSYKPVTGSLFVTITMWVLPARTKDTKANAQQKQEPLGLWSLQILDAMGRGEGIHPSHTDQHGSHHFLLLLRHNLLVCRQEVQRNHGKLICT